VLGTYETFIAHGKNVWVQTFIRVHNSKLSTVHNCFHLEAGFIYPSEYSKDPTNRALLYLPATRVHPFTRRAEVTFKSLRRSPLNRRAPFYDTISDQPGNRARYDFSSRSRERIWNAKLMEFTLRFNYRYLPKLNVKRLIDNGMIIGGITCAKESKNPAVLSLDGRFDERSQDAFSTRTRTRASFRLRCCNPDERRSTAMIREGWSSNEQLTARTSGFLPRCCTQIAFFYEDAAE